MTSDLRRRLFRDKAPVRRATPPDSPTSVSKPLEDAFHANPLIVARACLEMLKAGSSAAKGVADVQVTFAGPY
jgi:acetoin:2,6-dichlorophenolindophenol oxidoreductase subunit beta